MLSRIALLLVLLVPACAAPAATPSVGSGAASPSLPPSVESTPSASGDASPAPSPTPPPAAWSELTGPTPAAREDHTWTLDGAGETAFLFGGRDGSAVFGDLWAFDLATDSWSELAPAGPPPPARFGHEAAWVDGIGLVIVFGQAGASFFNDLWSFDPDAGAWTELPAAGAVPVARYGSCAAVGPDGRLWISHGFTSENARFSDTLAYDFETAAWTDQTPPGDPPVVRCLHGCWWTETGMLRLYAGQTNGVTALGDLWELTVEGTPGWARLGGELPAERNLYARARIGAGAVVFGGLGIDGGYRNDLFVLADESDAARPIGVEGTAPSGRAGAELVYDARGARLLLFGGRDAEGARADLWQLSDPPAG